MNRNGHEDLCYIQAQHTHAHPCICALSIQLHWKTWLVKGPTGPRFSILESASEMCSLIYG